MPNLNKLPMASAVKKAYNENQEDETLEPHVLEDSSGNPEGRIKKGDSVIFYNIRGEREIELTRSLTENDFQEFTAEKDLSLEFSTMIEYKHGLKVNVAFPPDDIIDRTLCDAISSGNLKQVKITEAEKAVHVSFFLNGKKQDPLPGEERVIIPTRKDVSLFDEAPEMSIEGISGAVIDKIRSPEYKFIFANFPNVDVVGHIENEGAVIRAVEAVDRHAGLVIEEAVKKGMTIIVTADHGTVEKWLYPDGIVDTGHTDSPVPFILIHPAGKPALRESGELTDVAPTILDLMGLQIPAVMTGTSLIKDKRAEFARSERMLVLILDGWGMNDEEKGNLIARAETPFFDRLLREYPSSRLAAAGEAVGLPAGTVGNSEAGHLHIGAGRKIFSDRVKIDRAIADGSFYRNDAFLRAMRKAGDTGRALHLLGIVSFFSSHGSIRHLFALMEMARREGVKNVFIHAMLGRRGEQPESGMLYISRIEEKAAELNLGRVVSVIGRYWSMDREENWDRIEKTYRMLVYGQGVRVQAGG